MCKQWAAIKLGCLLVVCMLAQGCVGIFVARTKTETINHPRVGSHPAVGEVFQATSDIKSPALAPAALKKDWGKPAIITPHSGQHQGELWTYRPGRVWCGIVVGVIVPVPLILPVANEKITFTIEQGEIMKAKVVKSHLSGFGAYVGPDGNTVSVAGW